MDMTHEKLVGEVFAAYDRALDQAVLASMGEDALKILWDRRPNKEAEMLCVVIGEVDPKDIHDAHYSEDGKHIPHRRGGER